MFNKPQRITQAHLRILEAEPHRYRRLFLDGLELPKRSKHMAAAERGKQFHQLMQQHALDLPVEAFIEADPDMQRYFDAYRQQPPPLIEGDRQAEYPLVAALAGFQLYGVADLLIRNSQRAQIIDWKTYRQPRTRDRLEPDWQTKLYLYLLKQTSPYAAESLSMVYWFAEAPHQTVIVSYDSDQHRDLAQQIEELLIQLSGWLETEQFPMEPQPQFSMVDIDSIPAQPLP